MTTDHSTAAAPTTIARYRRTLLLVGALTSCTLWAPRAADLLAPGLKPLFQSTAFAGPDDRPLGIARPISSKALPNVPGKRLTVVKVTYAPGGYTPAHHHAGSVMAYVTAGAIRSQLAGGPIETFAVGESFFEPPGAVHLVSENASATEPAELLAVFVADEGATLTTSHK